MTKITVLAVDLGAEPGRVMAVQFDGRRLYLEQLHRFTNPLTSIHGTLYWDMLHLWREIQAGIEKGKSMKPASIGVDTWGIDFGLLDQQGQLIGNPINYRDRRTDGMMEAVFSKVSRKISTVTLSPSAIKRRISSTGDGLRLSSGSEI